jgi:Fe-Mn family superoxide dismutase
MLKLPELKFSTQKFKGLSQKAFQVHHEGHHATYVNKGNELLEKLNIKTDNELEIIKLAYGNLTPDYINLFNNVAQHWNHSFFWESISDEKKDIDPKLAKMIESQFGSSENFFKEFEQKGASLFGSGWVWLVLDKKENKLKILQTQNAINPFVVSPDFEPLLVVDVWEHAYYLDHMNKRVDYLKVIINALNWENATKILISL